MSIKQFAIPLDGNSNEPGDITFKALAAAGSSAEFQLTNVSATSAANELNLRTKKNGVEKDHKFSVTVNAGSAKVMLTSANLNTVYGDADGGNWDYVEAKWTIDQVDTPNSSNMYELQGGNTYNLHGWPPN